MIGWLLVGAFAVFTALALYSAYITKLQFENCGNILCDNRKEDGEFFCAWCED
jgi:predicted outer membrane lipoprotein